jgi:hypothetical protein
MHVPATGYVASAVGQLTTVHHAPDWFLRFVNSNVMFTGIPTIGVVLVVLALRLVARRSRGRASWTDFNFGLHLVIAAIVAIPAATTFRVLRELIAVEGTTPRSTLVISGVLVVSLIILGVVLARAAGEQSTQPTEAAPSFADLAFGVFVPDLAGIFAVMLVLLFASRGGTVPG